eukprot:7015955-Ditylum_brightwellii.AAC.1
MNIWRQHNHHSTLWKVEEEAENWLLSRSGSGTSFGSKRSDAENAYIGTPTFLEKARSHDLSVRDDDDHSVGVSTLHSPDELRERRLVQCTSRSLQGDGVKIHGSETRLGDTAGKSVVSHVENGRKKGSLTTRDREDAKSYNDNQSLHTEQPPLSPISSPREDTSPSVDFSRYQDTRKIGDNDEYSVGVSTLHSPDELRERRS